MPLINGGIVGPTITTAIIHSTTIMAALAPPTVITTTMAALAPATTIESITTAATIIHPHVLSTDLH